MLTSRYAYCGRLYSLIPGPLIESHSWATCTVSFPGHSYSLIPRPLVESHSRATCTVSFPGHCPIFLACSTNHLVCKNESVMEWCCILQVLEWTVKCVAPQRGAGYLFQSFWCFTWKSTYPLHMCRYSGPYSWTHAMLTIVSLVIDENSPIYNKLYAGFHTEGGALGFPPGIMMS